MDDDAHSDVTKMASQWLARRDRGFSAAEQDEYLEWLRQSPAHAAEIARLQRTWDFLNNLRSWQPAHSSRPNPDLLAPARRHRWVWPTVLAAAAAVVLGIGTLWMAPTNPPAATRRAATIQPGPQRMTLEDGSLVELNNGAKVEVCYTEAERNVTLLTGEAHFVVAKNPARPFTVTADRVHVRAVGTAFDVNLENEAVAVLVTEGRVQLNHVAEDGKSDRELSHVSAGQVATVSRGPREVSVQVRDVNRVGLEHALAWQSMRLEFVDLPLREVIEEFNRYNSRRLVVEDEATGAILVGGSFRADNLEPFVRLLDAGFGITAETRNDTIVLRKR